MNDEIEIGDVIKFDEIVDEFENGHQVWLKAKYLLAGLYYSNVASGEQYYYLVKNCLNEHLNNEEKKVFIEMLNDETISNEIL